MRRRAVNLSFITCRKMLLQPSHSIVNILIKHVVNPYQAVLPP